MPDTLDLILKMWCRRSSFWGGSERLLPSDKPMGKGGELGPAFSRGVFEGGGNEPFRSPRCMISGPGSEKKDPNDLWERVDVAAGLQETCA